jgi:DNA polymerase
MDHRPVDDVPPPGTSLKELVEAARHCRRCPLFANATQTVFGEGPRKADVILIGEQPGDKEDLEGRPFVGPAGRVLDRGLREAGIDRAQIYLTNAVKHFKNEPRGKRRLHKTPDVREVTICSAWLQREIEAINPKLLVAMGATAARALTGKAVPIGASRGHVLFLNGNRRAIITVHPSFLLRVTDETARAIEFRRFVSDLRLILREAPHVAL